MKYSVNHMKISYEDCSREFRIWCRSVSVPLKSANFEQQVRCASSKRVQPPIQHAIQWLPHRMFCGTK